MSQQEDPDNPPPKPDLESGDELDRLWAQFEANRRLVPEHEILRAYVGRWDYTADFDMFGYGPNFTGTGTMHNQLFFEGRHLQMDINLSTAYASWQLRFLISFDTVINKFHFIGYESLHNGVLILEGPWHADSESIRLWGEGSNPMFGSRHDCSITLLQPAPNQFHFLMRVPDRDGRFIENCRFLCRRSRNSSSSSAIPKQ